MSLVWGRRVSADVRTGSSVANGFFIGRLLPRRFEVILDGENRFPEQRPPIAFSKVGKLFVQGRRKRQRSTWLVPVAASRFRGGVDGLILVRGGMSLGHVTNCGTAAT